MEIVLYAGIVLFILVGPWVLVARVNSRRKRDREEDRARWADLTSRLFALEQSLQKLKISRTDNASSVRTSEPGKATTLAPVVVRMEPAAPSAPPSAEPSPPQIATEEWVQPKPFETVPAGMRESATPPPPPIFDTTRSAGLVEPAPEPAPEPTPEPSLVSGFKSGLDIEEALGTNWLNKIGIAILVLGIAFFLAYQLKTLGPAGKVLVGLVIAGVMLGGGIFFDRKDRYRVLARAGIGGGWALLFFTTYAMYHVPAAQVLSSQALDLVLLLIVATAMVLHTLRYQSQVVTGLAFLLAFLTVTISHSNVYSLAAGAVLAAGLVIIVGRMQWFELEVFGILASYLNHYLWLRPIIEPMQGHRHRFPEFVSSAAILILYWLIFRLSYVFRQPRRENQEHVSTAAALLNTALVLALFKYQSTHPEWAFWALLTLGAIETALGQLPVTRRRRTAVIVLSTLGVVLLLTAFPFRFSGTNLSILWLADAEALLLIGVWTKEVIFRRLGVAASVLAAAQMLSFDAARILGRRMDDADLRPDFALAIVFVVAAIIFYANAHWLLRRWKEVFTIGFDRTCVQRMSYAGALMLLTACWIAFPESWTAVGWCALGLALAIVGGNFSAPELGYQANFFAATSLLRVLAINFESPEKFNGVSLRLITVALTAGLLYLTSRWNSRTGAESATKARWNVDALVGDAYTWAASFLLSLLAWYELRSVGVADAWVVGGVVLLEVGLTRKNRSLRLQSYVALTAGFLRIFLVNLDAAGPPGEISPRFYTVVPIALAFFYSYWRLRQQHEHLSLSETRFHFTDVCCWLGTLTIALLMRFELEADWVAAAWAALAFALLAVAWRSRQRAFLYQAFLIVLGVLSRTVFHNFYERSYFPASGWQSCWITVGATVALLLAALPIAFQLWVKDVVIEGCGFVQLLW